MDKTKEIVDALRGQGCIVWVNTSSGGSWFPELTVIVEAGVLRLLAVVDCRSHPVDDAMEDFSRYYYYYTVEGPEDALVWLKEFQSSISHDDRGHKITRSAPQGDAAGV